MAAGGELRGRARVVTGGPGCGKSAVLSPYRDAGQSQYRKEILVATGPASLDSSTLPPEGVVSVAVHARRKLLAEVVARIAFALNLNSRDAAELVEALARRSDKTVIVIDALDEADDNEQIVSRLLTRSRGCRMSSCLSVPGRIRPNMAAGFAHSMSRPSRSTLTSARYIGADDVGRYVERRLLAAEEPGRTPISRIAGDCQNSGKGGFQAGE